MRIRQNKTWGAVICLLGLLGAQAAYSAHQHHHHATETTESCEICLQFERTDDVLPGVEIADASLDVLTGKVEAHATDPVVRFVPTYRSRAPPIVS